VRLGGDVIIIVLLLMKKQHGVVGVWFAMLELQVIKVLDVI
jgi:hypothetical protein